MPQIAPSFVLVKNHLLPLSLSLPALVCARVPCTALSLDPPERGQFFLVKHQQHNLSPGRRRRLIDIKQSVWWTFPVVRVQGLHIGLVSKAPGVLFH